MTADVSADLSALVIGSDDFRALSERMDIYCPFEAMGTTSHEIRHSNFLADILSPSRPHGFGNAGLEAFVDAMFPNPADTDLRMALHLDPAIRIDVRREWRDIDLLIVIDRGDYPTDIIAVELKIHASESNAQLDKYAKILREEWPTDNNQARHHLRFLTLQGQDASDPTWQPIAFASLIDQFDALLNRSATAHPPGWPMLQAYVDMMRRRHLENPELERLATQIWAKHGAALSYLMDQRPNPMREVSRTIQSPEVFARIAEKVKTATGIEIELDTSTGRYTRISVRAWDDLGNLEATRTVFSGRILMCELECYGKRINVHFQINPGQADLRRAIYDRLTSADWTDTGKSKRLTDKWTRLAARNLHLTKAEDDHQLGDEFDLMVQKTEDGLVRFLTDHLPDYTKALESPA